MSAFGVACLLFGSFAFLLFLGCPIMVSLGVASMLCFLAQGLDLSILVERAFASLTIFPLMALPAFVLAGALMEASGISRRLVAVAEALAGAMPGGMAIAAVLACVFFAAISGSGPATTAAIGMLMIPALIRQGYSAPNAAAITATAGGLGIIIPPSVAMVVYGVSGQVSISAMFMAGVVPGLLLAGAMCLWHYFRGLKNPVQKSPSRKLGKALLNGFWALLAPVLVLGGIYAGFFTPTEAAVVSIFYTLIVGVFIYRELDPAKMLETLNATSWLTGRVLLLVFTASAFGFVLTLNNIPQAMAEAMLKLGASRWILWLLTVLLLLFLGMFMETLALVMLVTPVLLPVMTAYGVDPVHFGLVMICCCGVGFATPPLGENIFVASAISGQTLEAISLKCLPMVGISILVIALLVAFPELSLWLPALMESGL